jgi:hypothetical protein
LAIQLFKCDPSDRDLARFVDPAGRGSFGVRVEETVDSLTAYPAPVPAWFVFLSCALPAAAASCYCAIKGARSGLESIEVGLLVLTWMAVPFMSLLFVAICNHELTKGQYFALNKTRNELRLPRSGLVLSGDRIMGFVEFRGWCVENGSEGTHATRAGEVTVLLRTEFGQVARHSVVINDNRKRVSKIGETLAEFFRVDRRQVR